MSEGQSVQLNCSHSSVEETGFTTITWLRQTNQSAPVSILSIHCRTVTVNRQRNETYRLQHLNGFNSKHMNGTMNNTTSTLEIRDVNVSDSGLYYCLTQPRGHMIYHNATYLTITGNHHLSFYHHLSISASVCECVCLSVSVRKCVCV